MYQRPNNTIKNISVRYNMRTQLLCTFTKQDKLNESIDIIVSCNKILYDKVYVFTDVNDPSQLLCTYNVEFNEDFQEPTIDIANH